MYFLLFILTFYRMLSFNLLFRFAILDVRPAMDSWENVWDRMRVAYWRWRYELEDYIKEKRDV